MPIEVPFLGEWESIGAARLGVEQRADVDIFKVCLKKFLCFERSRFVAAWP
jgi:hypothetical protein